MFFADQEMASNQALLILLAIGGVFMVLEMLGLVSSTIRRLFRASRSVPAGPARSRLPSHGTMAPRGLHTKTTVIIPGPGQTDVKNEPPKTEKIRADGGPDKRKSDRRKGMAVRVEITDAAQEQAPSEAGVVDVSRSGICLAVAEPVGNGTVLHIRPQMYRDESEWVQVVVRNCRRKKDAWQLGCQFVKELPWSTLLMFG